MPQLAQIHGVVEVRTGVRGIGCPGANDVPCIITSEELEQSGSLENGDLVVCHKFTFVVHGQHHIGSIQRIDFNALTIFDTTNTYVGKVRSGHYALARGSVLRAGEVNLGYGSQMEVRSAWGTGGLPAGGIWATLIASNITVAAGASITGRDWAFPEPLARGVMGRARLLAPTPSAGRRTVARRRAAVPLTDQPCSR